jgi:hypothetical protein
MKKAAIILLILIYGLSTAGLALKADYCCDNLKSIKLVLAHGAKDKGGCCKVKYQSFQIKDAHAPSDVASAPALHFTSIHALNSIFQSTDFAFEKNNYFVPIHAPPLYQPSPIYISNCVFRI